MHAFGPLIVASAALLVAVACAVPIRVGSYVERGADLQLYRSYDFAPLEPTPTGDPRLDSNPFFTERVQAAASRGLADRGYVRSSSDAADLLVHFHASVVQGLDIGTIDRERGRCPDEGGCRPYTYDAGTLVMDLVDARTGKLVWRGWAESNFQGMVDNQALLEERIDIAMARLLAQLPRRPA